MDKFESKLNDPLAKVLGSWTNRERFLVPSPPAGDTVPCTIQPLKGKLKAAQGLTYNNIFLLQCFAKITI